MNPRSTVRDSRRARTSIGRTCIGWTGIVPSVVVHGIDGNFSVHFRGIHLVTHVAATIEHAALTLPRVVWCPLEISNTSEHSARGDDANEQKQKP